MNINTKLSSYGSILVCTLVSILILANWYPVKAIFTQIEQPFEIFIPIISNGSQGYFVSPDGNDSNPGTYNLPWRTVRKAANTIVAGDTVYVRSGIYQEAITIAVSGTEQKPIVLAAFPGETPIIDGGGTLPGSNRGLVYLKGDWIRFSGFEVRNSSYSGVQLYGRYNTAENIFSHHNQKHGIYVQGDYGTVIDSRIWRNALVNENNKAGNGSSALTTSRDSIDKTTDYAVLRNNLVWENWGIGINSYESNGTIIEGNIVHDNLIGNIYINDATNIVCTRNFLYMTPGSITYGLSANFGFLLGDEVTTHPTSDIILINNIAYGNNYNLKWSAVNKSNPMIDILIANNTFANVMPNTKTHTNIDIRDGSHHNVRIFNNIFVQDDDEHIENILMNPGILLSHNLWSKPPHEEVLGDGDIVADPKLARVGTPYTYQWFELLKNSPAIDYALILPEVSVDYLGQSRGPFPDVGAIEK